MSDLIIQEVNNSVVFKVKAVPGSSRTAVGGLLDGMLKVKIAAPPEKGKANQCLIEFLTKELGVRKNAVSIVTGQTNPIKQVQVMGMSGQTLLKKLGL
jgi:hypothetical protein